MVQYKQQIVGMAAVGRVYMEALIIAYGEGSNGKSTFWNTVARVLGTYSGNMSAGHDIRRGVFYKIIRIVLPVMFPGNLCIEGDHNQPSPDAGIHRTHLRQMVGVQHKGMARREGKRVLILFLRKNLIRGTELFDDSAWRMP